MLKKINTSVEKTNSPSLSVSIQSDNVEIQLEENIIDPNIEKFKSVLDGFHTTLIGDPIEPFNADNLNCYEKNVNYGILDLLEGTWLSYMSPNDKKINESAIDINKNNVGQQKLNSRPYLIASGIHTTIMPSPGTNSETIPGKYSFECDQYIEKLTFTKVEGGVRNRGGVNEQFCGAYKYDQVIKKVNFLFKDLNKKDKYDYFPQANPVNEFFDNYKNVVDQDTCSQIKKCLSENFEVKGIHEENRMYLWLSDVYNHAATEESINTDRGMKPVSKKINISILIKDKYYDFNIDNPLYIVYANNDVPKKRTVYYPNKTFAYIGDLDIRLTDGGKYNQLEKLGIPKDLFEQFVKNPIAKGVIEEMLNVLAREQSNKYILIEQLTTEHKKNSYYIIPAKELSEGDGLKGPHYLPDYTLSRSGVIPHGSTITLLGNIKNFDGKLYQKGAPVFIDNEQIWDYKHLSISPTMGRAGAPRDYKALDKIKEQFNIDGENGLTWRLLSLPELDVEDPGGNKVYAKQIVSHPLYPYSVRPDLRLRDSIVEVDKDEEIIYSAKIEMFTKNESGTQGGILNIPFVNKYVPTIDMTMNMWLQVVKTKKGNHILQLQYEQVVNFEFHFGDDGGTTRWPHIQVNTLRKEDEMSKEDIDYFKAIFDADTKKNKSLCPFGHK